jgi:hypothetical protein
MEQCKIVNEEDPGNLAAGNLVVEITPDPDNRYGARISIPEAVGNADRILDCLQNEDLAPCVVGAVFGGRWKAKVNIPFNSKGKVIVPSISITRELIKERRR